MLQVVLGQHTFTYDNVYGSGGGYDAANLYPDCVQPLVDGLFKGYNATVFAYGELRLCRQSNPISKAGQGPLDNTWGLAFRHGSLAV